MTIRRSQHFGIVSGGIDCPGERRGLKRERRRVSFSYAGVGEENESKSRRLERDIAVIGGSVALDLDDIEITLEAAIYLELISEGLQSWENKKKGVIMRRLYYLTSPCKVRLDRNGTSRKVPKVFVRMLHHVRQ